MSIIERLRLIRSKDKQGNEYLDYPVTTIAAVKGLNAALANKADNSALDAVKQTAEAAMEAAGATKNVLEEIFGNELPDSVLANNSPGTIKKVAEAGLGANFWSVGDKIPIELDGTVGALTFNKETYYAFIIGFNHNPTIEGENSIHFQFGKTAEGTDIIFFDGTGGGSTSAFRMNLTETNIGGWENSYMRRAICTAFLATLPTEWRYIISPCIKYSDNTGGGATGGNVPADHVTPTLDNVWLLAEYEVFGKRKGANKAEQNYQQQYEYYANGNSTVKYKHSNISSSQFWWLRSPYSYHATNFCHAHTDSSYNAAHYTYGFAPGFMVA